MKLNLTFKYIDDFLLFNNPHFNTYINLKYPSELEIETTTDNIRSGLYLGKSFIDIDTEERLQIRIPDKCWDFNCQIVNLLFVSRKITSWTFTYLR